MNSKKLPANLSRLHLNGFSPRHRATRISSTEALEATLNIKTGELLRIASQSNSYYRLYERKVKADGSIREIFSIAKPLKTILKKVNSQILKNCYYPPYLTGSLPKIRAGTPESELKLAEANYLANARRHSGQGTVIRVDATNFFPSITDELIFSVWGDLFKFSPPVAELLTKLTTYQRGLAQGSPTSSYLANLALWRIEPYIAQQLKKDGVRYSRYVDDIVVSTKQRLSSREKNRIVRTAQKVFLASDLKVKTRKTEIMDLNQQQRVHNVIVNSGRPTAGKNRKQLLRATLHRLKLDSRDPAFSSEDLVKRRRSLEGKIREYTKLNPTAGARFMAELRQLFE